MEAVYEQFFFLKYSGGWSFSEAYNLPIGLRNWFLKRLVKQIETENEAMDKARKNKSGGPSQTLTTNNQPPAPPQFRKKTS